jgi:hypothetical protein
MRLPTEYDHQRKAYYIAIAAGTLYGIVAQFWIRLKMFEWLFGAMSFGFVFILRWSSGS